MVLNHLFNLSLTCHILIGIADLDFLFHMFFLARYCKLLEENSFRGRTADFFYMLLFGATVLTGIVLVGGMIPYLAASFAKIIFLSNSLTFMMVRDVYICSSFLDRMFLPPKSFDILTYLLIFSGLCMEQTKSLHPHELPRPFHFHCCLPSMGV